MKKTRFFIFITALLITLLTVVGCDVSPVTDFLEKDLVKASISINGSRSLISNTNDSLSSVEHFD